MVKVTVISKYQQIPHFLFLPSITFSSLLMSYYNKSTDSWPTSPRRSRSVGIVRVVHDTSESETRSPFTVQYLLIVIPARDNASHKPRDTPAVSITVSQPTKPPHPVASTSSSVLPSPFPPHCPEPPLLKPCKQEIVHSAPISTAKKGVVDHSLFSREDESHANPGDPAPGERARAATPRRALLVPIKPDIGGGQLLPRTPCPDATVRVVDQDTVQVCPPQCPFCAHLNTV